MRASHLFSTLTLCICVCVCAYICILLCDVKAHTIYVCVCVLEHIVPSSIFPISVLSSEIICVDSGRYGCINSE